MKIVCAPDSFKETLAAADVAAAMARGIRRADPSIEIDLCPLGDGGEGTMHALIAATGGTILAADVTGPRGEPVLARYGVVANNAAHSRIFEHAKTSAATSTRTSIPTSSAIAIIELAEASGLALVPHDRREPIETTTYGTGELIRHAVKKHGCTTVIVCVGGSATIDGGTGIIQALGGTFWDQAGNIVKTPMTGGMLKRIARCRRPTAKSLPIIRVACDVTNPLCGLNGAAAVYGPQKGATRQQFRELDAGLAHLAQLVGGDSNIPGTGAAGGAAFGLMTMCNATLERGIDLVLHAVDFERRCRDAALVLTGEGRLDHQSLRGKTCIGAAAAANTLGVPTIAIVGAAGRGAGECTNPTKGGWLKRFVSLAEEFDLERAKHETAALIEQIAEEVTRDFMALKRKSTPMQ